ncbi:MAG: tetratricopeptide repeat protein [Burkholderiales bacterium]|jgi:tetratricopeptide (TPR) repeat protein|nr:tetratricopeptide repeat protein [Burkholderiales bacterium]
MNKLFLCFAAIFFFAFYACGAFGMNEPNALDRCQTAVDDDGFDDVKTLLARVFKLSPKTAKAYIGRGRVYLAEGNNDLAIDDFTQAIRLNPNDASAYNYRGFSQYTKTYSLEDIERAVADYNLAIRLDPSYVPAYINRGHVYSGKASVYGQKSFYPLAVEDFNKVVALCSVSSDAYIYRGKMYLWNKRYDKALADVNHAIELDPKNIIAYVVRSNIHIHTKDYQLAIEDYNKVIDLYSIFSPFEKWEVYRDRGIVFYRLGEFDHALADFNKVLELDPKNKIVYFNRGLVYYKQGDYDRAIADFDLNCKFYPKHKEAYFVRGLAYKKMGDHARAKEDFNFVVELDPKNKEAKKEILLLK